MTRILDLLASRSTRAALQVGALLVVVAAVAAALADRTAARVAFVAALGVMVLFTLKLVLVALQRQQSHEPVVVPANGDVVALRSELERVRSVADGALAESERVASTMEPIAESLAYHQGLARRTEPAIAEFATLRHEVIYLRETVARLQAERDT